MLQLFYNSSRNTNTPLAIHPLLITCFSTRSALCHLVVKSVLKRLSHVAVMEGYISSTSRQE